VKKIVSDVKDKEVDSDKDKAEAPLSDYDLTKNKMDKYL
jgi:hypothetical protein